MNMKILGIIISGVIAIGLVLPLALDYGVADNAKYTDSLRPPDSPITKIIAGKSVTSVQEASTKAGYNVKSPQYLPTGYQVRVTNVDAELGIVTLLASPSAITPQTTDGEFFMQQKGILIFMEKNIPDFDTDTWMSNWAADHSAEVVSIDGLKGAVHPIVISKGFAGEQVEAPAELVFVRDDVLIEIRGMVSTQELIRIAQSL